VTRPAAKITPVASNSPAPDSYKNRR
jgi:hypothetical protein